MSAPPAVTVQNLVKKYGHVLPAPLGPMLFASLYSDPLDPDQLLESLGIKQFGNSSFKNLSGGQKQRVSVALALVGNPRLAILDELTTGLDPEARREIWSLIERMKDRGVTVILVTHFMDEAERLCDRHLRINSDSLFPLGVAHWLTSESASAGSESSTSLSARQTLNACRPTA